MGKGHSDMRPALPFALSRTSPLTSGGVCLEPTSCPCESEGSFFPLGTVLQKGCGNW